MRIRLRGSPSADVIGKGIAIARASLNQLAHHFSFVRKDTAEFTRTIKTTGYSIYVTWRRSGLHEVLIESTASGLLTVGVFATTHPTLSVPIQSLELSDDVESGYDTIPIVGDITAVSTYAKAVLNTGTTYAAFSRTTFNQAIASGVSGAAHVVATAANRSTEGSTRQQFLLSQDKLSDGMRALLSSTDDIRIDQFTFDTTYTSDSTLWAMHRPGLTGNNVRAYADIENLALFLVLAFSDMDEFWVWNDVDDYVFTNHTPGTDLVVTVPNSDSTTITLPIPALPEFYPFVGYFDNGAPSGTKTIEEAGAIDGDYYGYSVRIKNGVTNDDDTISGTIEYRIFSDYNVHGGNDPQVRWLAQTPTDYDLRDTIWPENPEDLTLGLEHNDYRVLVGVDAIAGYYVAANISDIEETGENDPVDKSIRVNKIITTITPTLDLAHFLDYSPSSGFTLGAELTKVPVTVGPGARNYSWYSGSISSYNFELDQYVDYQKHERTFGFIQHGKERIITRWETTDTYQGQIGSHRDPGQSSGQATSDTEDDNVFSQEYTLLPTFIPEEGELTAAFETKEGTFYRWDSSPITLSFENESLSIGAANWSSVNLGKSRIHWSSIVTNQWFPIFLDRPAEIIDIESSLEGFTYYTIPAQEHNVAIGFSEYTYNVVATIPTKWVGSGLLDAESHRSTLQAQRATIGPDGIEDIDHAGLDRLKIADTDTMNAIPSPVDGFSLYYPNIVSGRDGICIAERLVSTPVYDGLLNTYQSDPTAANRSALEAAYAIRLNNFAPRNLIEQTLSSDQPEGAYVVIGPHVLL